MGFGGERCGADRASEAGASSCSREPAPRPVSQGADGRTPCSAWGCATAQPSLPVCAAQAASQGRPVRVERSEPRSGALDGPTSGATRVPVPAHALRATRQPESPATAGIRRALERSPHPRKQHKRPKWANLLSTGRSRRPHDCGVTYLRESGPRSESRVRVNGSGRRSGRVAQMVTSPVRSARSERQTRSGSARSRTARHSSRRGYIARTVSGRRRASLVR